MALLVRRRKGKQLIVTEAPADKHDSDWQTPGLGSRVALMAKGRRKTLVTCRPCHENIHVGRAAAPVRT